MTIMQQVAVYPLLIITLLFSSACGAQETPQDSPYSFRRGDYDGIGKWYMEREIARVMGYQGMSWLERPEREKEENTSTLIENMDIQVDDVIADIGAGSGYHVFKMSEIAKEGKVYAVDIQDEMLEAIRSKMDRNGVTNIETIKGSEQEVNLPMNSLDKVLMVDVYHEFAYPVEMMASIFKSLKPDGLVYLIEYRAEDPRVPIKRLHKMSEAQAVKEMEAAGMELVENMDNLPWQHCMIFRK
jgi:SAM-dependent methyltransferase